MTTIAADARLGVMASDSWWSDETQCGIVRKVFRIRGDLVGFSGTMVGVALVKAWMAGGCKVAPPSKATDVTALILRGKRLILWKLSDGFLEEGNPFFAIGSGGIAARAAMMAGADAATAVRISCNLVPGSGGAVRVYKAKATQ